jgi:hypothetical protein
MRSDDPDFEPKAADVIGRYVSPPPYAAVFAADEKTAIQALGRLDPVLPLSPEGFAGAKHISGASRDPIRCPRRRIASPPHCRGS